MSNPTQTSAELFKFEGKPSWGAAFPQAMQHVLAMLIGNITPPMLIAGTCGLSAEDQIMLTQAAMIIGGLTTLLQLFPVFGFGMKLPNVMGVAFAYMPILTIIGEQYGIAAIFGSQLVAGFVSIFVGMLIGIVVGYAAALIMGNVVSFADLQAASWFALPRPFYFGLEFHPDAIVMMILMYMVQAVQTIGDVSSTAMGGFGRESTDTELGGAIKGQGICGMIGACIGGLPTDPYSQNVGLICTTKVVARRVFTMVGVIMLAAGIFPKFSGLMATIPQPVLGGATVTVFAAITMSGIQLLNEQPLNYRNRMIVGIALALGLGIDAAPDILQFVPQLFRNLFGSSLVVSFLVVFLLNILIPKDDTPEE